ncbi:hypothetical protein BN1723_018277 [Verticillium longisporum]|uniref:Uncharacterized protein n=1 Tax=Verticillium longisporum TaxID=100787 RepID=A0A0G4LWW9_VERLO|nr:hypothetical protein BN1723_018277 [Verticillium longisporum]
MPDVVLHAERVQELVEVVGEDGVVVATEYHSWETFRGLLAPVLKWSKRGELCDGFARWMGSLKAVAEGGSHDEHDVARLQTGGVFNQHDADASFARTKSHQNPANRAMVKT